MYCNDKQWAGHLVMVDDASDILGGPNW
jgi:hypothetical protein